VQTRREITREATVREIKETALARMRESGSTEVRFADIARDMRMSAPGLYRYFDGRDELLTALIADAFTDLAQSVELARDEVPPGDVGGRLLAICRGFRRWALHEPQRLALVLGPPVPGYVAPADGPTTEAARRAMAALKSVAHEAATAGLLRPPWLTDLGPTLCDDLADYAAADGVAGEPELPPAVVQSLMHAWSALYGFVSLEAFGHLSFHSEAAREALFVGLVRTLAGFVGLPAPAGGWPADPGAELAGEPGGGGPVLGWHGPVPGWHGPVPGWHGPPGEPGAPGGPPGWHGPPPELTRPSDPS
jgi:AcrR family transcriptional regulator